MSNPDENLMATEMLIEGQLEPYSYSGRDMYGRHCLAVNSDSVGEVFASALQGIADNGAEPGEMELLIRMMREACVDNMGMGVVVYWPNMEYMDPDEEEDEESDGSSEH